MKHRVRQRGFTLVELLVVISIIGMLIALLLPAVNAARETARANDCLSKLTNLGKATISYESRQGQYPGYSNVQAVRSRTFDIDTGMLTGTYDNTVEYPSPTGWIFPMLTYLDRNDLAEQYGPRGTDTDAIAGFKGVPPNQIALKIVQCPSDIIVNDEGSAGMSYVANSGFQDITDGNWPYPNIAVAAGVAPDYASNGVFMNRYRFLLDAADHEKYDKLDSTLGAPSVDFTVGAWKDVKVSSSTILSGDGTTNTLLFSENVDGGRWTDYLEHQVGFVACPAIVGTQSVKPTDGDATLYSELATDRSDPVAPVFWINENAGKRANGASTDNPYQYARPSSYHANGVNVMFAGGNGRFLTDTIDPLVYAQLMSVHGSRMVVPDENGPVQPTADWLIFAKPLDEGAF